MAKLNNMHAKTQRLVVLSLLASLIIILQLTSSFLVKLGLFSISLVLIPITVGGILYGIGAGALLGGIFGLICFIAGIMGIDGGTLTMIQYNVWFTALIAIGKGIFAGAASAAVYKLFIFITKNKQTMSAVFASIATPVVNTGLYLIGMVFLFKNYLIGQLGVSDNVTGSSLILVVIGIIWVNFIIEFILNVVICPIISSSLLKNGKIKRIR